MQTWVWHSILPFFFFFEMEFCYIVQADLKLPGSSSLPGPLEYLRSQVPLTTLGSATYSLNIFVQAAESCRA